MKNNAGLWPIAIALIICTLLATNSFQKIRNSKGTISVKGCAEKQITSDYVKWEGSLTATANTLASAYEKLEKDLGLLRNYFNSSKVKPEELTISPIRTSVLYGKNEKGHSTNVIEGYTLTQDFAIGTTDIQSVKRMSQEVTTLIKEGVEIASYAPNYLYRRIDELKIFMLGEAAKDAKQRADALVKNTGTGTGVLLSAHQGVFQITPAFSTMVSDYGEYDTTSIEKTIKAVVTMEFGIE